ncbi:MAG TPA: hypothetical protein VFV35_04600 [Acidimicrobiales bacterium]|nr:hypothetical protein [Acidimicrobiales bacterium]
MLSPAPRSTQPVPIVSARSATIPFEGYSTGLRCVYVQVDARGRSEVADFLTSWEQCCDETAIEWRVVRRPPSALVRLVLCRCQQSAPTLVLAFDVRRDAAILASLLDTEAIVVASRPYGRFANAMAAYRIDGTALRGVIAAARRSLADVSAVAS